MGEKINNFKLPDSLKYNQDYESEEVLDYDKYIDIRERYEKYLESIFRR